MVTRDTLLAELASTARRQHSDEGLAGLVERAILSEATGGGSWWGVVDIVNPAQTFHYRQGRTPPRSRDVERKLLFGRYVHEQLAPAWFRQLPGFAIAEGGVDGAHTGLGGIRGRIDFRLGRSIIELKTTELGHESTSDVWAKTPQDLEQLLMYGLMTARPEQDHFLVYYRQGNPASTRVFKARIRTPGPLKQYFLQRKGALETAIRTGDPTRLGRCRYFDTGCDVRGAGICHCVDLPPLGTGEVEAAVTLSRDESFERRLDEAILNTPPLPRTRVRAWDLFVPRQAFRDLVDPRPFEGRVPEESYTQRLWAERRLGESELAGQPTDLRLPGPDGEPASIGWSAKIRARRTTKTGVEDREVPLILRVPRPASPKDMGRVPDVYIAQLALRCALINTPEGALVLAFPRSSWQCLCYRIEFDQLEESRAKILSRYRALMNAIARSDPSRLPLCPDWIEERCGDGCMCRGLTESTGPSSPAV